MVKLQWFIYKMHSEISQNVCCVIWNPHASETIPSGVPLGQEELLAFVDTPACPIQLCPIPPSPLKSQGFSAASGKVCGLNILNQN